MVPFSQARTMGIGAAGKPSRTGLDGKPSKLGFVRATPAVLTAARWRKRMAARSMSITSTRSASLATTRPKTSSRSAAPVTCAPTITGAPAQPSSSAALGRNGRRSGRSADSGSCYERLSGGRFEDNTNGPRLRCTGKGRACVRLRARLASRTRPSRFGLRGTTRCLSPNRCTELTDANHGGDHLDGPCYPVPRSGQVAQLEEHGSEEPGVGGSIPSLATTRQPSLSETHREAPFRT